MNEDFYIFVNVEEIALRLNLDESVVDIIFVYWKLKRKVVNLNIFCIYSSSSLLAYILYILL